MTRENKLALVVGFGLILLVGILISDHFSAASRQEPAELTKVVDPLAPAEFENPDLIALRTAQTKVVPLIHAAEVMDENADLDEFDGSRAVDPIAEGAWGSEIEMGWSPAPPPATGGGPIGAVPPPTGRAAETVADVRPLVGAPAAERRHHVRPSESLSEIASHYYGTVTLTAALAKANRIADPDLVPAGMSLRIPDRSVLTGKAPTPPAPSKPANAAAPSRPARRSVASDHPSYKVRPGDTLSKIAADLLGSARRWNAIFEANGDILESPDDVEAGMVLKIPRSNR